MAKENPDRSGASPPSSHPTTLHPAFPKALEPYPARHPALPYELAKPANSPVLLARSVSSVVCHERPPTNILAASMLDGASVEP
eukprot:CCRYP_016528-RD/>CCRYP_016528-RD protein AED:0.47 eAED:0.66 QI:0/0/0/1/0/0/2/0/83